MNTLRRTLSAVLALGFAVLIIPALPAPATGGDCETTCNGKRTTCDATCIGKQQVCIAQCGLPGLPGYDKCFQKCNSDESVCSLECQADQEACKLQCKVGR